MRATYRLQLGPGLGFAQARDLVPYLADLGVSHVYLSPIWRARPGSTHGYDVLDPTVVNPELGGEEGLRALAATAAEHGLGLIADVVPNHMATDDDNPYWSDAERRAVFFDLQARAGDGPTHRRFFDIEELAGVRQEDPKVFAELHAKVVELVDDGVLDGMRVDHPDGLADPTEYLARLADAGVGRVWVEKILEDGEQLRPDWACEGTTGYEFLVDVQALFVDPAGEAELTALWADCAGDERPFADWAAEAKLEQAQTTFTRELARLDELLPLPGVAEALASLPVYRTYVREGQATDLDHEVAAGLPEPVRDALLGGAPAEWIVRAQQTSAPIMAKGVEDTAFYRYHRLVAHNEVGGDPGRFSLPVERFHVGNARRADGWPRTLLAGTTHDTKRSADVRARIGALASIAEEWAGAVRHWRTQNAELRASDDAPTAAEELLLYQTLIGAWPIEGERLHQYLIKALREAKQTTNWITPDEAHEQAVLDFADALIAHGPFRYGFDGWAMRVAELGRRAALGQLLLRLTAPGVPDLYQGDELEFLALVDPDNRRPVDWDERRGALEDLRAGRPGPPKLDLIARVLDLRRRRPEPFAGSYTPLRAGEGVCAYLRGDDVLVAVALREDETGAGGWQLPEGVEGRWRSVLDGAEHELPGRASLAGILGPGGRALLERA